MPILDLAKSAPDFKALNAPVLSYLTRTLGDRPGAVRGKDGVHYVTVIGSQAVSMAIDMYDRNQLGIHDRADALHILAHDALRYGYGREAVQIAAASDALDFHKHLFIANLNIKAYAIGVIDGDYNVAHGLYNRVDQIRQENDTWDDSALIESALNKGRIYYRKGLQDARYLILAENAYEDALNHFVKMPRDDDRAKHDLRKARLAYGLARTLTALSQLEPRSANATLRMRRANGMIQDAVCSAREVADYDFERACIKAAFGDIKATVGERDEGIAMMKDALAEQVAANPTIMSRLVDTEARIYMLEGDHGVKGRVAEAMGRLKDFHGYTQHPDIVNLAARFAANTEPPLAVFMPRPNM